MKKNIQYSLAALSIFLSQFGFSQVEMKGTVSTINAEGKEEFLPGANVYWLETMSGTTTDSAGRFSLPWPGSSPQKLIVSFVGYRSDTIALTAPENNLKVMLKPATELDQVDVNARNMSTQISMIKPVNMEVVTSAELKKAACCNLSESFESNASVDVVYGDAVSGARAIQMLGLSGVYTQMLTENVPMTRGLSANFGLQYIPGTWVESIQITKGVGSVVNGYESMSGQINLEFLKPENHKADRWFINLYGNHMGRAESNIHFQHKFSDKVSTMLFVHTSGYFVKNDRNKDGFLDNPLSQQINILNRWKIQNKKTEQVFSIRGLYDDKIGGQVNFDELTDRGTTNNWGLGIRSRAIEGYFKNGFLFPSSPTRSMGIILSAKHHVQDSYYGLKTYYGEQNSAYANVIFQDVIGNTNHQYKTGLSFLYDNFKEKFVANIDTTFLTKERVPGAFFEYTYTYLEKFNLLAGLRADLHNLYGLKFTPRLHLRYSPNEELTFRASGGTGFRTPHVIIENAATLASSRNVYFLEKLLPEESLNAGGGITKLFKLFKKDASIHGDYYYTEFKNQIVVDLDYSPHMVMFYNLRGRSFSHSAQVELDAELVKGLTIKAAYKHYLVMSDYRDTLMQKPMVPRHRTMFNVSYQTPSKKWKFDLINNWYSASRLPDTKQVPDQYRFPEKAESYLIMHFQVTKLFRHFEWYLGAENILDFRQTLAIMDPQNPFGSHFDASMTWGPLNGRIFYTGIRIAIKKK